MKGVLLAGYRLRGIGYAAGVALLLATALVPDRLLAPEANKAEDLFTFAGFGLMAASLLYIGLGSRLLPKRETRVVCAPVEGRWLGMNSPASRVPSHGVRMYGQAHAIDLVAEPLDGNRPKFGTGPMMRPNAEYPAFGAPVFAMVGGTVVRASDWRRDHKSRSNLLGLLYLLVEGPLRELGGPGFIIGNHVTIRAADGTYALLAHLQQGSLNVRVGEVVSAGMQVARCGNSGNSSEPHVHAQLMDRVSPLVAQGLPMVFQSIILDDGLETQDALPENDQRMLSIDLGSD